MKETPRLPTDATSFGCCERPVSGLQGALFVVPLIGTYVFRVSAEYTSKAVWVRCFGVYRLRPADAQDDVYLQRSPANADDDAPTERAVRVIAAGNWSCAIVTMMLRGEGLRLARSSFDASAGLLLAAICLQLRLPSTTLSHYKNIRVRLEVPAATVFGHHRQSEFPAVLRRYQMNIGEDAPSDRRSAAGRRRGSSSVPTITPPPPPTFSSSYLLRPRISMPRLHR